MKSTKSIIIILVAIIIAFLFLSAYYTLFHSPRETYTLEYKGAKLSFTKPSDHSISYGSNNLGGGVGFGTNIYESYGVESKCGIDGINTSLVNIYVTYPNSPDYVSEAQFLKYSSGSSSRETINNNKYYVTTSYNQSNLGDSDYEFKKFYFFTSETGPNLEIDLSGKKCSSDTTSIVDATNIVNSLNFSYTFEATSAAPNLFVSSKIISLW